MLCRVGLIFIFFLCATGISNAIGACNLSQSPSDNIDIRPCTTSQLKDFWSSLKAAGRMPNYGADCFGVAKPCESGQCNEADQKLISMLKTGASMWRSATYYTNENGGTMTINTPFLKLNGVVSYGLYPVDNVQSIRVDLPHKASTFFREVFPGYYFGIGTSDTNFSPAGFFTLDCRKGN
ncbi:uncharacterized protein VTP21DRAFT_6734 [Calcarisporiella thermophila]|uniref:uncharacterized protein n=1 Tax=Calcarisporiella thermophila TaxID=911321 RepID=UPI0037440DCD